MGVKLNPEQVTDFLLSDPKQETLDTFPKRYQYHQNVHLSHIKTYEQRLPSELELLIGLSLGFDNTAVLNMQVWRDLAKMKGNLSQAQQGQIIKLHNLQKIKQKIESLHLPEKLMRDLLIKYYPQQDKQSLVTQVHINDAICDCTECAEAVSGLIFKADYFQQALNNMSCIENFIQTSEHMIKSLVNDKLASIREQLKVTRCPRAYKIITLSYLQIQNSCRYLLG